MDQLKEPFSTTRDEQHPVRWSPADGDTPAYLTLKGALERLAGYGYEAAETRERLLRHVPVRTPFAFYMIDEPDAPAGAGEAVEAYRG
jgi:hypothetical protein